MFPSKLSLVQLDHHLCLFYRWLFCPCLLWDSSPLPNIFPTTEESQIISIRKISATIAEVRVKPEFPTLQLCEKLPISAGGFQWLFFGNVHLKNSWKSQINLMKISLILQMCGSTITWYCFRLIWKEWGLTGWVGLEFPIKTADCDSWSFFVQSERKIKSLRWCK